MKLFLSDIILKLGGRLEGDNVSVNKLSSLANAVSGDISFLADSKYSVELANTKASAIVLAEKHQHLTNLPKIIVDQPYTYFAQLSTIFNPPRQLSALVHSTAVIANSARIPSSCHIGANVVIG